MSIFSSITQVFTKLAKDKIDAKAMSRSDVEAFLAAAIQSHKNLSDALDISSSKDLRDWMTSTIRPKLKDCKRACCSAYDSYKTELSGNLQTREDNRPFSTLSDANDAMRKLLEKISDHLDEFFEKETVTLKDTRLSQLAVYGIIQQSDELCKFTEYLYSFIVRVGCDKTDDIPKNRDVFLMEHAKSVGRLVDNILNKNRNYDFLREVKDIRTHQSDVVIGIDESYNFDRFVDVRYFRQGFLDSLLAALSYLNIFGRALDQWELYKINKNERRKETRDWMVTHTALLRMELAGTDPNDPQYLKLQSIISAYDDKIAEYDRQIEQFENGA